MVTRSLAASPRFLDPAGRFDRSAIMLAVHAEARRQVERAAAIGCTKPLRYAVAFRDASANVWASARVHRECFLRDAALAALPAAHASLLQARTAALMIDSTRRMVAELAAIDAQAAALGILL